MNLEALSEWQAILGDAHVLHAPQDLVAYQENTSAFEREIAGVLLPGSVEDVQALIRVANIHRTPLYPISTGKNWGMGSRLPVEDGAVIVDLRRLNAVRSLDDTHHVAVIEPGVTQGQLFDHLQSENVAAVFNVTGSARDTSIVGNTLERGVGYFASRADDILWLEVVLGDGRIVRTGYAHFDGARARDLYRHGLGPDLTGTFMQANFGIVTAIAFKLIPRAADHMAMLAKISDASRFADFVQALTKLRKSGIVQTAIHIGNQERTRSTIAPLLAAQLPSSDAVAKRSQITEMLDKEGFGPWSAVGGIFGSSAQLALARREIRSALAGVAQVTFLTDAKLKMLTSLAARLSFLPAMKKKWMMANAIRPLFGLSKGEPTNATIQAVYWSAGLDASADAVPNPDVGRAGVLYCLPIIPMSGAETADAVRLTEDVCASHGFVPYITFNMINTACLEGVINVAFDRSDATKVAAAHACVEALQDAFVAQGLLPYRLGIHEMQRFVNADDPFWQVVREMKSVFDPNHIIAPGRYNLV